MPSLQHRLVKLSVGSFTRRFRKDLTQVKRMRAALNRLSSSLAIPEAVTVREISIHNLSAEWLIPHNSENDKVLLYLHGGGYALGSLETHRSLASRIAEKSQLRCLTIDYRLAPEHPFPAALEDACLAYEWLLEQGYKAGNIVLAGDSAGGGLCVALQILLRQSKLPLPAAAALMSPWVELDQISEEAWHMGAKDPIVPVKEIGRWAKMYAGEMSLSHPLVSPIRARLKGLAPMMIQVSDSEVLSDQVLRFAEKASDNGVNVTLDIWEGMIHVWQVFWRLVPEASDSIDRLAMYLRSQLEPVSMPAAAQNA